jgi:putative tryptophan/tyrosine transport system substrate-binding protein
MSRPSRREFIQRSIALAGVGLMSGCSLPLPGVRPAEKIPVVGILTLNVDARRTTYIESFRAGLRELGYIEDQTITIETGNAQGDSARLLTVAAELVSRGAEVIVAGSTPEVLAAKSATDTMPIVMMNSADPVSQGFVASLSRPSRNVTGLTGISRQIVSKRFELLSEMHPGLARVAVLWNSTNPAKFSELSDLQATAGAGGVEVQSVAVGSVDDFPSAFDAISREGAQALCVLGDQVTAGQATRIANFASANRIPAIMEAREFAESGGLMSFGPNTEHQWRRGASYVDRILKGAKPGDLPVEQATTFDLVVNRKTVEALGLTIRPGVLQQATEIIE